MRIYEKMYKHALVEVGISQGQLAILLGVAPSTLSAWVHGFANPPEDWVQRIENRLGLEAGTLLLPDTAPVAAEAETPASESEKAALGRRKEACKKRKQRVRAAELKLLLQVKSLLKDYGDILKSEDRQKQEELDKYLEALIFG